MKKLSIKQIILIPIVVICTILFLYLLWTLLESYLHFFKVSNDYFNKTILLSLGISLFFCLMFGLQIWLVIISMKKNIAFSAKKQVALIIVSIICGILLILCLWFLLDNFINVTLPGLKDYQEAFPDHPSTAELKKAIPKNICFYITLILFYGINLWLSIPFMRKPAMQQND